jgi:outer membrane receptor protein involved in Fe transport
VQELFLEALVPLVQDTPGFQDLSLELGYRYSDYSTSGGADTYKGMLSWAPSPSFKIRGGYNRAIRSANAFELFEANSLGLGGSEDICANRPDTGLPAATLEECMRTGVTEQQYGTILANPADQYNTFEGGNPDLEAEVADTYTFGVVITPEAIPGFTLAVDWYDIEIDNAIDTLDADDIVQTCARTGDPQLCDLIHRDRLGSLWIENDGFTTTITENIGLLAGEGIDLNASYLWNLGNAGFLQTDLTATYLLENLFTNPLVSYDCVGYYGFQCGQPNPEWRHRMRVTWETNFDMAFSLAWRRVGESEIDDASPDPDIGNPDNMESHRINGIDKTDAYDWLDLSATYTFRDGIQFTVGINNITDEEPPLWPELADEFDVNTYATYEPLGRFVHTSVRFNF